MKLKKILAVAAGTALVLALATTVAACGDGDGGNQSGLPEGVKPAPTVNAVDTFIGTTSKKTYDGEETAVKAFFKDELLGEYVGYDKKGTLPAEHVAKLGLTDAENVKTVTAVSVKFNPMTVPEWHSLGVYTSAEEMEERTFGAYAIEYKDGSFKYYSPRPDNGEVLTKSYYLSLIEGHKYANCTAIYKEEEQEWRRFMPDGGTSFEDAEMRMRRKKKEIESKAADTILVESVTANDYYTKIDGEWVLDEEIASEGLPPDMYVVERDGRAYETQHYYSSDEGSGWDWHSASKYVYLGEDDEYGSNAYTDFDTMAFETLFDRVGAEMFAEAFSLFEKTVTGFKATEEAFKMLPIDGEPTDKYFYFDVDGGKIVKLDIGCTWMDDGEEIYNKYSIVLDNFGQVEAFSLPEEYSTALDEYIAEETANDAQYTVANAAAWTAAFDYASVTNYCLNNTIIKQAMIGDEDHGWTQTWCDDVRTSIYRDGDKYLVAEYTDTLDWEYVNTAKYTYKYKDGGEWHFEVPTGEYDPSTGLRIWEETEGTAPSGKAAFSEFEKLFTAFDSFVYDVYAQAYKAVFVEGGKEYLYIVEMNDGKVVRVEKKHKENGTYTDGSTVELDCYEEVYISDVGEVNVNAWKGILVA